MHKRVAQRCFVKKVFLVISQNSQENTCARVSFLIKLPAWGLRPATLLKKRVWYRCFPVNFVKFLRTPFLTEHLQWLLLNVFLFLFCLFHLHNICIHRKKCHIFWNFLCIVNIIKPLRHCKVNPRIFDKFC